MSDVNPSFGHIAGSQGTVPERDRFRIAVFGDFTGRSANGLVEIGAKLAERRAVQRGAPQVAAGEKENEVAGEDTDEASEQRRGETDPTLCNE